MQPMNSPHVTQVKISDIIIRCQLVQELLIPYICFPIAVREAVSMICEKIENLLGTSPSHQVTREDSIILDTDSLGLPQNHLEVF